MASRCQWGRLVLPALWTPKTAAGFLDAGACWSRERELWGKFWETYHFLRVEISGYPNPQTPYHFFPFFSFDQSLHNSTFVECY